MTHWGVDDAKESNYDGSARIDGSLVTKSVGADCNILTRDRGQVQITVDLLNDVVGGNLGVSWLLKTWHDHVRCNWVVLEVEGEAFVGLIFRVEEDCESIKRDKSEGEADISFICET